MSALSEAQIRLVFKKDSAFFASMMYQITWEFGDVPTAGINHTKCIINEQWFNGLPDDHQVGLLAHEIMHLVLMHPIRRGVRDHKLWNVAGDYLINYMLVKQGFTLPEGGLYSDNLNDSLTTEEIYDILVDDDQQEEPQYVPASFDCDLAQEGDEPTETESKELEAKIAQMVTTAVTQAKMSDPKAGNIPNGVELMLDGVLYPKIPWTQELYEFFCEISKDDYSMQKRNRRYRHTVIPSLHSEGMGKISTYLDISCSVTDEQFAEQHGEMMHIKNALNPSEMEIVEFDTSIKQVRKFTSDESIHDLTFTGRGGTCLREVGKRIAESDSEVSVIFTDGYVNLEPVECLVNKRIIWCIIDNKDFTASHGKVIHLE